MPCDNILPMQWNKWEVDFVNIRYCGTSHGYSLGITDNSLAIRWCHNGRESVSNQQPHDCLLNRLFSRRSKKHQSSAPLAFVRGIRRGPVNSPHKLPVTRKMLPFDDVIMLLKSLEHATLSSNRNPLTDMPIPCRTFTLVLDFATL